MKFFIRSGLVLFSLCFYSPTSGQDFVLDSLKLVLKNSLNDTNKLSLLEAISDIAPDGEWELYSEEMGTLAQQLMTSTNPSLKRTGKRYYAVSLNNKGFIALEKGDYNTALDYYEQCLRINSEIGDKKNMALFLGNIGVIYDRQGDIDEAMRNYKLALAIQKEIKGSQESVATYNNIGVIYSKKNQPDSALFFYLQGLKIAEQSKFKSNTVTTLLSGVGNSLAKKGKLDSAMKYFTRGLKMSEEIGDNIGKSGNLRSMAGIYFNRNELHKAGEFARQALSASMEANNPRTLVLAAGQLKKIYEKQGNYIEAYKLYQLEISNRDSLESKENQKAVMRHQFKYEYDLKEATVKAEQEKKDAIALKELQKQKLVRNGFIGGFGVVLLFAGVFFTQRNKIKIGKKRSDELLLNILPSEVAEELKEKGSAGAKQFSEVTVMFTDFKGFTQISEKLSPTELVNEIHTCFKAFDDIISKHNVEKIKTIGDSYMCAGGLPVANTTNATDVVSAAIEIQHFMQEHLKQRKNENKEPFEIRIGIHTGSVVAGIVGVKKFAYDIWGDTVNIASRMESSGEAGKVNISGTTYELVKDKFICTHRGKIQAKNKGEIDMFFVSPSLSIDKIC